MDAMGRLDHRKALLQSATARDRLLTAL